MSKEKTVLDFRALSPEEVSVRIGQFTEYGVEYLICKKGHVDAKILNEAVGPLNWQCRFSNGFSKCEIDIWDDEKKEWVTKEDAGDANNQASSPNKCLATDSFKRAGFRWGIGEELKELPKILVSCDTKLLPRGFEPKSWDQSGLYLPHVTEMEFTKGKKLKKLVLQNGKDEDIFVYTAKEGVKKVAVPESKSSDSYPSIPSIDLDDNDFEFDFSTGEIIPQSGETVSDTGPDPAKDLKGFIASKGGQV